MRTALLSISAVLALALLATPSLALPTHHDQPQAVFGGQSNTNATATVRNPLMEKALADLGSMTMREYNMLYQKVALVGSAQRFSYPKDLAGHSLVRFNATKYHTIPLAPFRFKGEMEPFLGPDPIENFLMQLDVWERNFETGEVLAHFTPKQYQSFLSGARALHGAENESQEDWVTVAWDLERTVTEQMNIPVVREMQDALMAPSGSDDWCLKQWGAKNRWMDSGKKVDFTTWFDNFHRADEIRLFYEQLAEDYPHLVTFIPSIGKTVEERDIFAVKITAKEEDGSIRQKSQVWWQGLQHAREWAGGSTVQYLTYHYLTNYGKDDKITEALLNTELVIVPIMNIDGYEYTWTNNRLWRKNRRQNQLGAYGVDLNRNWNDHFGEGGSSSFPWSETYRGPSPASEPEVQALASFFAAQHRIVGAIDFHCYSQLVLRPEGWTSKPSPHEKEHKFVGDKIASLIASVHGKKYVSEPSYALYKTTGAASDWFYGDEATKVNSNQKVYSYTIELRPSETEGGRSGFILPPEQIRPLGEEIATAMEFFVDYVVKHPLE